MGLELDEIIYKKVLKYFKNKRLNDAEILSRQINLSDIKPRLTLFARAICGAPIEIFPAEREGGYKNKNFFLPINCSLFPTKEENLKYWILLFPDDPVVYPIRNHPEFKQVMKEIEAKFWKKHEEIKLSLTEKGVL